MRNLAAIALLLPTVLVGCASTMTGLDGGSQFSCKAPDGVTCSSLSGVYANAVANNLPALRKSGKADAAEKSDVRHGEITGRAPVSGEPIRTQPKVLRVWIAPWEDADGDLHDQSFIYVMTDPGRWKIEHHQKQIIDRYRPTFVQAGSPAQPKQTPNAQQQPGNVTLPGAQMYGGGQGSAMPPGAGGNQ